MFVLAKTRYTSSMSIARLRLRVGRCRVEKEMASGCHLSGNGCTRWTAGRAHRAAT